jgi:AbrB family looped-hinge helix DNA binding protein
MVLGLMSDNEVVVTRKGQTTIPAKLRAKYGMQEGAHLVVVDTGDGVAFRKAVKMSDLAGSGASHGTPEKMKRLLDKMREEG